MKYFILFLFALPLLNAQGHQQPDLRLLKPIPNLVVEQHEQVMLPLNDYYSGPLIDYSLTIKNSQG